MSIDLPAEFDFTDPHLWEARRPVEEFAEIRRTAPVWWNAQTKEQADPFGDEGYWVVSRHEEIREISKNPQLYSSHDRGAVIRLPSGTTADIAEAMKSDPNNEMIRNQSETSTSAA